MSAPWRRYRSDVYALGVVDLCMDQGSYRLGHQTGTRKATYPEVLRLIKEKEAAEAEHANSLSDSGEAMTAISA